jgi:hypothetical protein
VKKEETKVEVKDSKPFPIPVTVREETKKNPLPIKVE